MFWFNIPNKVYEDILPQNFESNTPSPEMFPLWKIPTEMKNPLGLYLYNTLLIQNKSVKTSKYWQRS